MIHLLKMNSVKLHIKIALLLLGVTLITVIYGLFVYIAHADTTNTFSGTLKDQNGNAISGVWVQLRDTQNNSVSSQTTSTGSFNITINPGMYSLKIYSNSWLTSPARLVKFSLAQPISSPSIDLTSNSISQDLTLPLGKVNYTEYNAQGYGTGSRKIIGQAPASNTPPVSLYPGGLEAIEEQATTTNDMNPSLDGTGDFTSILGTNYAGTSSTNGICTTYLAGSPTICNEISFTAVSTTNTVDIPKAPLPRNTFSGKFSDSTGTLVNGIKITLRDTYGNEVSSNVSWSDGHFSIAVEPGMFSLRVEGDFNNSPFGAFKFEQPSSNSTIDLTSGNASEDLTLPVGIVNFTTTSQTGSIIPYAKIIARGTITSPLSFYPGGPMFNPIQTNLVSQKIFSSYQGIGTFKAIVGSTYHGTGTNDGVCTDATGITLCNTAPLLVGTNNIAIGPQ